MLVKLIREGLGRAIVFTSFITRPKPIQRSESSQALVNEACEKLSLYQFYACPFCVKVRRAIHRLNLPIEYRDTQKAPFREELEAQGGRIKVPCLRIESDSGVQWMYESNDIIAYLEQSFSEAASSAATN